MIEHFTWGIILKKENIKESDSEYTIFTWDVGKIKARGISSRKILSRLAGHLEPGTFAAIRVIKKKEDSLFKVIEALSESKKTSADLIKIFELADYLIPLEQPDIEMFYFLKNLIFLGIKSESGAYASLLKIAGFDPKTALCGICGQSKIAYFSPRDIIFLCALCQAKKIKNE